MEYRDESTSSQENIAEGALQSSFSNSLKTLINDLNATCDGRLISIAGIETLSHERTLPNVLTRIKYIIDQRITTSQHYKDADFKQFWLPDHLSKGCYDCSDRFTPLRRRHHCRVCGQIFCSKCCNKLIPGKIIGYKGDLRVCTYCYKVVLTYLQSSNIEEDVLADLRALQEDILPQRPSRNNDGDLFPTSNPAELEKLSTGTLSKRKSMFRFMEESYAVKSRSVSGDYSNNIDSKRSEQMSSERQLLLKDSQQLQSLWSRMVFGSNRLPLTTNRHRLKVFPDTFIGREFVQWLLVNDKASSRQSAIAISQALLEAGFIFCVSQMDQTFSDEHVIYSVLKPNDCKSLSSFDHSLSEANGMGQEPLWLKQISSQIEDDANFCSYEANSERDVSGSNSSESCAYTVDLNLKKNLVSVKNNLQNCCDVDQDNEHSVGTGSCVDGQTTVTSVLNDSIVSSSLVQNSGNSLSATVMVEEVLEALKTLEPKLAEATAAGWQLQSEVNSEEQLDEQTRMSLEVHKKFNGIWSSHESAILTQLLQFTGLDLSWANTMVPLAYKIVETVRPDVKNEADDMDLRQYIQFKKVPGGKRTESCIINGTVCSKNVSHRQMKTQYSNPQILVIGSHIDYYRSGGRSKAFSNENLLVLEEEYIKHVVAKILSYKPDIVITGEGVSFVAKEYLMAENVTLVMNVKRSVIERISRCTQAQVIRSVDSELVSAYTNNEAIHHVLGMCHSFYLRSFSVPSSEIPKILMFFDGCATHLGCTVILRGASNRELRKVKRIMYFLIYFLYNWKLERSFLMDEFASVPSMNAFNKSRDPIIDNRVPEKGEDGIQNEVSNNQDSECETTLNNSKCKSGEELISLNNIDPSDPPQDTLKEDTHFNNDKEETSASLIFPQLLKKTVLSVSPFIKYDVPYLESKIGAKSPLRKYFPKELYFSILFNPNKDLRDIKINNNNNNEAITPKKNKFNVEYRPVHSFIHQKITTGPSDLGLKSSLADFRARGCTIRNVCHCEIGANKNTRSIQSNGEENENLHNETLSDSDCDIKESYVSFCVTPKGKLDALHPYNHQRISFLFFSFSHTFQFTSIFCAIPRLLTRDFYGRNDITLGDFLESYCFDPSYRCPSAACQSPSLRHVRKFVHESGCVEVLIRKMDSMLDESNSSAIYMWTWCKICREVSPVVPMSGDTWLFSFAKYLELRFHDSTITRRGAPNCCHSIHQDHFHYFGQKDLVAVLKYNSIPTRELIIPPSVIHYVANVGSNIDLTESIKSTIQQGYRLFYTIVDYVTTISEDTGKVTHPTIYSVISHHHQQKQSFKDIIENIQYLFNVCRSFFENRSSDSSEFTPSRDSLNSVFAIVDQIVRLKRIILQVVRDWNSKVQDLLNLKKKEDKDKLKGVSSNSSRQTSCSHLSITEELTGSTEQGNSSNKELENSLPAPTSAVFQDPSVDSSPEPNLQCSDTPDMRSDDTKKPSWLFSTEVSLSLRSVFSLLEGIDANNELNFQHFLSASRLSLEHSLSDDGAEVFVAKEAVEKVAEKRYSSSVKNIISTLRSSSADFMIKTPFPLNEHYTLLPELRIPLVIYDEEPSSIIAKALASQEYESQRQLLCKRRNESVAFSENNFVEKPNENLSVGENTFLEDSSSSPAGTKASEGDKLTQKDLHIDLQWSDQHANYYCKVLFVDQFHQMRRLMFPSGEECFIRSLSRCVIWEARGGKSGSFFCKTTDDRFILKGMSRFEISSFLDFAPSYIQYMTDCKKDNRPTALTRIVGVYRIGFKNLSTNKAIKLDLLVMENLFYRRSIGPKFDLKGSVSNRKVNLTGKEESEVVLMDENLLQMVSSSPFFLRPHGKSVLTRAIAADTAFLSHQHIMDYSLLVGVDESKNELVIGIIDYIRTFTWDKKLETIFKGSVLGAGTGKLPTVISPEMYRKRFCHAMENYFVLSPDRWTGLGLSFDS